MSQSNSLTRRSFLAGTAAAGLSSAMETASRDSNPNASPSVVLFSKHIQWAGYTEMAERTAEMGFDGVDLTVRKGGHVLPENVERDLPKAVEAVRKAGLDVQMISTRIADPDDPQTETILKTASALGIPFYRIGSWRYDKDRDILSQLREYPPKLKALAAMNEHYHIRAGYHNHSGERYIGGPVWDIAEMLRGVNTDWIGSNFDPGHAVSEGGCGAWETNFKFIAPLVKMSAIKDMLWVPDKKRGCKRIFTPIGEGMLDWKRVLNGFKAIRFTGPFSLHFEYPVEGSDEKTERKNLLACIKKDFDVFTGFLHQAGLR